MPSMMACPPPIDRSLGLGSPTSATELCDGSGSMPDVAFFDIFADTDGFAISFTRYAAAVLGNELEDPGLLVDDPWIPYARGAAGILVGYFLTGPRGGRERFVR